MLEVELDLDLELRVRAACCDLHGLSEKQFEQHVAGIVAVVIAARERNAIALKRETALARRRARE